MKYWTQCVSVHVGLVLACIPVLAGAQTVAASTRGESPLAALIDPALRSPLATPTVQLAAEVGDDSNYATGKVGAAAFVTRDFWDNAWGLELPVYCMARPDGGFTGGLVLTYNGTRERFDMSVFVGQVFNLSK